MSDLPRIFGSKNYIVRNSARSALCQFLFIAKKKIGFKKVVIPSFCCQSIYLAVIFSGCKPLLVDVDNTNFSLSISDLKKKINDQTLAILLPHIFGINALKNPNEIYKLKKKFSKSIWIEDACQTFIQKGLLKNNLGMQLDVGLFSFDNSKPLSGSMGMIVQNSKNSVLKGIFEEFRSLKNNFHKNSVISELKRLEASYYNYCVSHLRVSNNSEKHKIPTALKELYFENGPVSASNYKNSISSINKVLAKSSDELNKYFLLFYKKLIKLNSNKFKLYKIEKSDVIWRYPIVFDDRFLTERISYELRRIGINCSNHYYDLSSIFNKAKCLNSYSLSNNIINIWFNSFVEVHKAFKIFKVNFYD